jgi:hypothetical protein
MPSPHSHREIDPLGLAQDVEGHEGPLSDWKLIASLNLPYAQIVKRFGAPPKAARSFFARKMAVSGCAATNAGGSTRAKPLFRQRPLPING